MSDPVVFWNGNIFTLNTAHPRAEALVTADGKIVKVGTNQEVRNLFGERSRSVDLKGKAVLPGFIDSHVHFMATAITGIGIDLSEAESIAEILVRVRERVAQTPRGEWVFGYFITHLSDRHMPTRYDLDRVSIDHPIRLTHRNGHLCSMNTKALEVLHVLKDLQGVEKESGELTGVVRDPAIQVLPHPGFSMTEESKREALKLASLRAAEKGVTTLHALDGGERNSGAVQYLRSIEKDLAIKLVLYNQTMAITEVLDSGLPRIGGCICADGAFESHTAALFEPYTDEPDHYGTLSYTQEEMSDFILRAHLQNLQVAVHCEGDRAIEQVLFSYERALRQVGREDHRHRIEHFEIPTENQLERVAKAGIVAGMQPAFLPFFFFRGGVERYESFLGKARVKRIHPYRAMLSHGILMVGGSDSPVTRIDPLLGISAAVNHPHVDERLSVLEAIKMFTINGSRAAFEEKMKGSIEAGKAADLVVLSEDPFSIPPQKIEMISVQMTLVDGRTVFSKN
ncbi:MAG: amidohydrolase [Deltaproteobacteria bacterium]|nr:amidohydrolase [Deltaproteobacteria bacterium]